MRAVCWCPLALRGASLLAPFVPTSTLAHALRGCAMSLAVAVSVCDIPTERDPMEHVAAATTGWTQLVVATLTLGLVAWERHDSGRRRGLRGAMWFHRGGRRSRGVTIASCSGGRSRQGCGRDSPSSGWDMRPHRLRAAPRADPSVRDYRTGLLPWVMAARDCLFRGSIARPARTLQPTLRCALTERQRMVTAIAIR
jgi:hypothetical protein